MLVERDDREEYDEDRWRGIGWLNARVVVIVLSEPDTQNGPSDLSQEGEP